MDKDSHKVIEESLIREVAAILSRDPGSIEPDIPLHEMGLDSLGFVELLVIIEKKFKIKLMESGLTRDDFRTIRALSSKIGAME
ncbi:MAG: acyl carrier protein [Proteobacteria bacterium]|nr:acyl carrier protein [Pseudomonadota bacterium]